MDTDTWREGPRLPYDLRDAHAVHMESAGSFALVGGYVDGISDDMYKNALIFDAETVSWTEVTEAMQVGRRSHVAVAVDAEIFPEC